MIENIKTISDVAKAVDDLAAHVVWMDIPDEQRKMALDALQAALKSIQAAE